MGYKNEQELIEDKFLLTVSVERMINTTISVLADIATETQTPETKENADINFEDWMEQEQLAKKIICRLWNEARNEAFKRAQEKQIEDMIK